MEAYSFYQVAGSYLPAFLYWEENEAIGLQPDNFEFDFKRGDYRVADDVGLPPEEVPLAIDELLDEVNSAMAVHNTADSALTIAAYAHAKLVDIHPFADGNGRVARLLMNYILLALGESPCSIAVEDRMAYFGALDAFHDDQDLAPFKLFLQAQTLKTWQE